MSFLNPPAADDYRNAPDGGPAFPKVPDDSRNGSSGMSLRDWFAGQATMGICAHADTWGLDDSGIVKKAYEMADLLLATRSSSKEA